MSEKTEQNKKSRWGLGIAGLYGGFVVLILVLVAYASFQKFELVEPDYYARELKYQDQIDRVKRTQALPELPRFVLNQDEGEIAVSFPDGFDPEQLGGTITMFRPSDSKQDVSMNVMVDTIGTQVIDISSFDNGLWKVKMLWSYGETDYYSEDIVLLSFDGGKR